MGPGHLLSPFMWVVCIRPRPESACSARQSCRVYRVYKQNAGRIWMHIGSSTEALDRINCRQQQHNQWIHKLSITRIRVSKSETLDLTVRRQDHRENSWSNTMPINMWDCTLPGPRQLSPLPVAVIQHLVTLWSLLFQHKALHQPFH